MPFLMYSLDFSGLTKLPKQVELLTLPLHVVLWRKTSFPTQNHTEVSEFPQGEEAMCSQFAEQGPSLVKCSPVQALTLNSKSKHFSCKVCSLDLSLYTPKQIKM